MRKSVKPSLLPKIDRCGATRKIILKSYNTAMDRSKEILNCDNPKANQFRSYKCEFCGFWHLTSQNLRNIS